VIPPDQHDQFDELGVVIAAGKHRPRGVTDAAVGMQFVGGPEQRRFEGVPVSTGAGCTAHEGFTSSGVVGSRRSVGRWPVGMRPARW